VNNNTMLNPALERDNIQEVEATFLRGASRVCESQSEILLLPVAEIPLSTDSATALDYQPMMASAHTRSSRCCRP
jgi:hypothetical protein